MRRKIAILIFDEVEVLDFAGPFEVFSVTRDPDTREPLFDVMLVAETQEPVAARGDFRVVPHYTLENCPTPDIILVPGGNTAVVRESARVLDWLRAHAGIEQILSVCTGAMILGKAGLLDGLSATTYHTAFERLAEIVPSVTLRRGERWVDNGQVVTSAGVSAGIDMALYVVEKLCGKPTAERTARSMEYDYYPR
ncbi:MAG: DJ-1/PfpI family protein [Chloroflexi bacterium]|nr:DJ-1/PfpI family protein [Chloroflexota bacterium]